ncbi:TPA: hypothetical protein I8273_005188 [Aeromonas hydrophila]|nr:hypothetical protein [Aeromonas hydrophila]HAT2639064.1 hypothetical protein [Aeromonas hydrophila]HAT2639623.1 hypothetical protein [Aeromonas hydrophila]HAT3424201.1 hypothetical protein [Aeromonas hydrophila]HAT3534216.1 hypothetical protein [Aeromonas hydrophila]
MSKTIARGAHVVTDTLRQNSRPIISVLDRNSLRDSLSGTIRESRREVAGRVYSGVRSGRGKFKKAVAGEAMSAARQLYFLMDASAPTLRNIPLEIIQNLMPQAIEMALLQILMQQPDSGPAIRDGVWSMVAAEESVGIATEAKSASKQTPVNEQPTERHKFKVATAAQLREQVLSRGEWLTAQQVSENAGYKNSNPSVQPNKWKKAGKIFAITADGKDLFPAYALGVDGKPLPQLEDVLKFLSSKKQPLAIASWFASANSWLGSKTPMESIADNPQGVLKAAKMEVAPIEHG